ncbi:MAG TPA: SDR family oxidoreductase [Pirellulales bacterium]|jgi:NAD(P)-dependent dehydrogenase (short-subunit alcohol dehydrogenase family)|nr:SDR family oxidoreductase [Pirellulales bacterium]
MNLELTNQVAVVIGAARGIGRAMAEALADEGAHVALVDRDQSITSLARQLVERAGRGGIALPVDVTDYAAVQRAARETHEQHGRVDHVLFAAGMGSGKYGFPFWNLEPADWRRVLDVNLVGAVNVAHAFAPILIAARSGTFLFVSSIAGQIGSPTDPPYSAAKAGLINFAQCAAKDLAEHNVRVNCVCPGMVKTELNQSVWAAWRARQPEGAQSYEEWAAEKIRRNVPLNRWQDAADVAALAVFLASSRAKNITGQTMNVDGGQVMHW